jgi:peptidoglycan/xylan/chitin deacetylase (PgdA/CDA1 family)
VWPACRLARVHARTGRSRSARGQPRLCREHAADSRDRQERMSVLRQPIPDKLVVLTFDDGSISQLRNAGPLMKELGFGGTFFITEGLKIPEDKLLPAEERTFMTWPEVRELEVMGEGRFEIANHTEHHAGVVGLSHDELVAELAVIDKRCEEHGLPPTSTFCYPG